jgi:glycosyltransferase involved in cell wall biosynthesis
MSGALVSVVMSVYNGGEYLPAAVESVLGQTYRALELVAIDDGSTDGSGPVLDGYASRDARVRVVHQENRGLIASLNRGVGEARGALVARMDADDVSLPDRIEKQVAAFSADSALVFVASDMERINADGSHRSFARVSANGSLAKWLLLFYNSFGGNGHAMFRRADVFVSGGYDVSDEHAEDYGLLCRLAARGKMAIVHEVLYQYRFHGESVSRQFRSIQMATTEEIARRHLDRIAVSLEDTTLQHVQRFWLAGRAQRYTFPPVGVARQVDAALRSILEASVRTTEISGLSETAAVQAKRAVADRYVRWASSLSLRRDVPAIV